MKSTDKVLPDLETLEVKNIQHIQYPSKLSITASACWTALSVIIHPHSGFCCLFLIDNTHSVCNKGILSDLGLICYLPSSSL